MNADQTINIRGVCSEYETGCAHGARAPNESAAADTAVDAGLEIALGYTARGWAIFPVHSLTSGVCTCGRDECESAGKHPRKRTGLKEATADSRQIREWWSRWPGANTGLATGAISGSLVLDIDADSGGEESLTTLGADHGQLPETVTALTGGGGRHLLFRHRGEATETAPASSARLGRDPQRTAPGHPLDPRPR